MHLFQCLCIRLKVLRGEKAVGPRRCWRMGEAARKGRCRRLCGVVLCCVCFWCGLAWLACLPAGVGVVYESLWWDGRCGVNGLRNGDCAGRHGGAPARPYVGGIAHTRRRFCLKSLVPFYLACKVPSCLLVLTTSPRHGKGDGDGDRRSIFFNVCASI